MISEIKACCTRPPVTLSGGYTYNPKGKYVKYQGIDVPHWLHHSQRGVLLIYDVFGLFIRTIRDADILASGFPSVEDGAGDYQVFMTDFFGGNPSDLTTFPPKTPSQLNFTKAFMTGPADPDKTVPFIAPIIAEIQHAHPEIESSAILGFCWGGKSQLSSRSREVFSRLRGSVHPSLVDLEDANKVTIPMVFLPSMVEDVDVMEQYGKNLKAASLESYCETFTDQAHGWMTSRADFNNLHAFEEYLRGYRIARSFFAQFL